MLNAAWRAAGLALAVACGAPAAEPASRRAAPRPAADLGESRAARVTVLEFSDFACHHCAGFARTVFPTLARDFVEPGLVRWRLVPLVSGSTPHADAAAVAATCAAEQQRLAPMHERLFERRAEWSRARDPAPHLLRYAREAGLDAARFAGCVRDPRTRAEVEALRRTAAQLGVRAAPTFLVNGHRVEGAVSLAEFRAVVGAALATD
ncbi:MAG TPA: thioredoxin domain-containing protein [Gemmatimonadaceae bacterium]|nr:thioredoxin domain-containing protein [Gemmatimonadaceae bacterium]